MPESTEGVSEAALEKRVEELQGQIQEEEVEKIDTNRFIALVNKYRNCEELTDTMLYAFIDRVEVHEATGGRTVYRQQNIDIYFNFIGNYYPPVETVSEEERIAAIEAEQLRKKQEKAKRAAEVQKQKKAALMKAVEAGDPEAIAEYERKLALQRERNHRRQQKIKEREYWAAKKGQLALDKENAAREAAGQPTKPTKFETDKAKLRRTIRQALSQAASFDEFSSLLLREGVTVKESRGRLSYLTPDRTKPITARKLGDDFDKAAVLALLTQNAHRAAEKPKAIPEYPHTQKGRLWAFFFCSSSW